jgi:hypothetical protein
MTINHAIIVLAPDFPEAKCDVRKTGDADLMFPALLADEWSAREVCIGCVHRLDCAEYAITNDIRHGVFGGMTSYERMREKGRRDAVANLDRWIA